MKVYIVSEGNEEFHRVHSPAHSDWNLAMKFATEELEAEEWIRENKKERDGVVVWEYWKPHYSGRAEEGHLIRVIQIDLN